MPVFYNQPGFRSGAIGDRVVLADGTAYTFIFNGYIAVALMAISVYQRVTGDGVNWGNVTGFPDGNISVGAGVTRIHNASGGPFTLNYAGWEMI